MAYQPGPAGAGGWRDLVEVPPEMHSGEIPPKGKTLLVMHHLSDLHICDAQSPIRPEFLDRWADPDSPIRDQVGTIGTYRPHSFLSPALLESMVQSLNRITHGPVTGSKVDAAIVTGDTTDNAQVNEVNWYLKILDGQLVVPDSGDLNQYEGVIDDNAGHYDPKYWHPHGTPAGCEDDQARSLYGFPVVPNVLNHARTPFQSVGLNFPWFAVHGNHDALLQGTVAPDNQTQAEMIGDRRYESLPSDMSLEQTLALFGEVGPAGYPPAGDARYVAVTADLERRAVERGEYAQLHLDSTGLPKGHGFTQSNVDNQTMYYSAEVGHIKLIVIDSVNPHGGWQGSIDQQQFEWIESEIKNSEKPVVLASHHPSSKLFNDYSPNERRICQSEFEDMLLKYPKVLLWLAGHEHRHHVNWIGPEKGRVGLWQIETASNIDWPQQSRVVELSQHGPNHFSVALTVVDHAAGPTYGEAKTQLELAALGRIVSANVWQKRPELGARHTIAWNEGSIEDRNVILTIQRGD